MDESENWEKNEAVAVERSRVGLFAAKVALRVEIEWWVGLVGNLRKGKRAEHSFKPLKR